MSLIIVVVFPVMLQDLQVGINVINHVIIFYYYQPNQTHVHFDLYIWIFFHL